MGFNTGSGSGLPYSSGGSSGGGGMPTSIIDQFVQWGQESAGNVIGSYTALQQKNKAEALFKKAEKLKPSDVDPNQVLQLQEIRRKQKAIESGTDPLTALATKQIKSNLATTQEGLITGSKGSARTLIEGLTQTERAAGDEVAKLMAANAPRVQFYEGLGYDLSKLISQRALDIQMYSYVSKLAQANMMQQSAMLNASNLTTNLIT